MIIGSPEYIMWLSLIAHGNHNNTPLIDRAILVAEEKFWALEDQISKQISAVFPKDIQPRKEYM